MILENQQKTFLHCTGKAIVPALGLRFWDAVRDEQITDDLVVTARPARGYGNGVTAFRTLSGIYAFQGLPGLHSVEYPSVEPVSGQRQRRFVIKIIDSQRRFMPAVFEADLPLTKKELHAPGFLAQMENKRPCADDISLIYLFSTSVRPILPGLGVIRGKLEAYPGGPPAAHAVMEICIKGKKWFGIADDRGNVAVFLSYPSFSSSYGGSSPPSFGQKPLTEQKWTISVRIYYDPEMLTILPNEDLPDFKSIFSQSPCFIRTVHSASPAVVAPVEYMPAEISFGQELVLPDLLVDKITSP